MEKGEKVEANYGGEGEYYPGKISRVNANGSVDIAYDDGDAEKGVDSKLVRRVVGGAKSGGGNDADADRLALLSGGANKGRKSGGGNADTSSRLALLSGGARAGGPRRPSF